MNASLAAKAFIVMDNEVLVLQRRSNDVHMPGIWELPGGRISLEENPFTGLQREVKEETGLTINVGKPLTIRHFTREDKQIITMINFLCTTNNKEVRLSEEHTACIWVPLENIKEVIDPWFFQEVDAYKQ